MSDFPGGPIVGQRVTIQGVTYEWNGVVWNFVLTPGVRVDVTRVPNCTTSSAPPAGPLPNDLWFDSTRGFFFIWFDDGTTGQWVVTNPGRGGNEGPPGPMGPMGPAGPTGPTGPAVGGFNTFATMAASLNLNVNDQWFDLCTTGTIGPTGQYWILLTTATYVQLGGAVPLQFSMRVFNKTLGTQVAAPISLVSPGLNIPVSHTWHTTYLFPSSSQLALQGRATGAVPPNAQAVGASCKITAFRIA